MHESHVELDQVETDTLQHVQGGVTAAEIIHPYLEAQFLESGNLFPDEVEVAPDHALRNLDGQHIPPDARVVHPAADLLHNIAAVKIRPAQVDRLGHHEKADLRLSLHLRQHLLCHIQIQLVNQLGVFQRGNKLCWRQETLHRIDPPAQRFLIAYLPVRRPDNRLIVYFDPAFIQCPVNVRDDIAVVLVLSQHLSVKICKAGGIGSLPVISSILGPVAGQVDVCVFQPLRIDSHPHRQHGSAPGFPAVVKQRLQLLLHCFFVRHRREVIVAVSAQLILPVMFFQNFREIADQLIAFFKPVLPVEMLHAYQVEPQHHRMPALRQQALLCLFCQMEEMPHVRQFGQLIRINPVVKVFNVRFLLVPHLDKGLRQLADLIPSPVIQLRIKIAGRQFPGGGGQPLQRLGNQTQHDQQQRRADRDRHRRDNQDHLRHLLF